MNKLVKWGLLSIVFAIVAIVLYTLIDSEWSRENDASIIITIAFFLMATSAIICGFNAADADHTIGSH
jgi:predicted neutral ceramidase superfamily lipid hydrolase